MVNNNLNKNFDLFEQIRKHNQNKAGPSNPRKPKKTECISKTCNTNSSKFIRDQQSGDVICSKCGVVQPERIEEHQNARQENGAILYARVLVEEDQKIKLLINNFFNTMFTDLKNETQAGYNIAAIYRELKQFRAKYITNGPIQGAFKGMHMPSIVLCILYCQLIKENRAMPMSIMVVNINQTLSKSRTNITPVSLNKVNSYRTYKKYGIAAFFKSKQMKCYNNIIFPNEFIDMTSNFVLRIQDKNIKQTMKTIADEIFKEYSDRTSPALIATGVLYYVSNKFNTFDYKMFGLKKKEITDISKKIESSQNQIIIDLIEILN